jgi:hypothetical protein
MSLHVIEIVKNTFSLFRKWVYISLRLQRWHSWLHPRGPGRSVQVRVRWVGLQLRVLAGFAVAGRARRVASWRCATHVHSGRSVDAARRLAAARSDRWGAARSLTVATRERWAAVVSKRLAAARRERWGTTVSRRLAAARRERRAARVVPRGCRVGGGDGDTAADWWC